MSSTFDLEREIIEGVAREAQRLCADIDRWQPGSELASTLDSCARAIWRCLAEIDAGRKPGPATARMVAIAGEGGDYIHRILIDPGLLAAFVAEHEPAKPARSIQIKAVKHNQ